MRPFTTLQRGKATIRWLVRIKEENGFMYKVFSFLLVYFFLAACQKNHSAGPDQQKPSIVVSTPTANQNFASGQNFDINATITDNTKIEEVHLEIVNTSTNTTFTHEHFVPGGPTYHLVRTLALPNAGSYTIRIEAEDTERNEAEVEIKILVN
ncbi:MAG TPA: DUF4625 domain-containing protein [Flavisolibacter sp.]|nr:DUF4625 domain-containing protein [Flavisolibacter sp.]